MVRMTKLNGLSIIDLSVNTANGIAGLNGEGKIPSSQLPALHNATDVLAPTSDTEDGTLDEWKAKLLSSDFSNRGKLFTELEFYLNNVGRPVFLNSKYFMLSSSQNYMSDDGINWTQLAISIRALSAQALCYCPDDGYYYFVGSNENRRRTKDFQTVEVLYGGSATRYCCYYYKGYIYTEAQRIDYRFARENAWTMTWASIGNDHTQCFFEANNSLYIVIYRQSSGASLMKLNETSGFFEGNLASGYLYRVDICNGTVFLGFHRDYLQILDPTTDTVTTTDLRATSYPCGVAYDKGLYVSANARQPYWSIDGVHWLPGYSTFSADCIEVSVIKGVFIAFIDTGKHCYSYDGKCWFEENYGYYNSCVVGSFLVATARKHDGKTYRISISGAHVYLDN